MTPKKRSPASSSRSSTGGNDRAHATFNLGTPEDEGGNFNEYLKDQDDVLETANASKAKDNAGEMAKDDNDFPDLSIDVTYDGSRDGSHHAEGDGKGAEEFEPCPTASLEVKLNAAPKGRSAASKKKKEESPTHSGNEEEEEAPASPKTAKGKKGKQGAPSAPSSPTTGKKRGSNKKVKDGEHDSDEGRPKPKPARGRATKQTVMKTSKDDPDEDMDSGHGSDDGGHEPEKKPAVKPKGRARQPQKTKQTAMKTSKDDTDEDMDPGFGSDDGGHQPEKKPAVKPKGRARQPQKTKQTAMKQAEPKLERGSGSEYGDSGDDPSELSVSEDEDEPPSKKSKTAGGSAASSPKNKKAALPKSPATAKGGRAKKTAPKTEASGHSGEDDSETKAGKKSGWSNQDKGLILEMVVTMGYDRLTKEDFKEISEKLGHPVNTVRDQAKANRANARAALMKWIRSEYTDK